MRARSGKASVAPIVWGVFLWVIVPAGLFAAGYKLVGPKIGEVPAIKGKVEEVEGLIQKDSAVAVSPTSKDTTDAAANDDSNGPAVEVTVERATGRSRSDAEPTRQKSKKKKKKPTTKPKPDHVRDEASGDAAMPGGDNSSDPAGGG